MMVPYRNLSDNSNVVSYKSMKIRFIGFFGVEGIATTFTKLFIPAIQLRKQ